MSTINPMVLAFQGAETVNQTPLPESTVIGLYTFYAVIAVGLVVFLARTLSRNGAIFLQDVFDEGQENLAKAVNQLLVVGFYLLNLGYSLLIYRLQDQYDSLIFAFNEMVVRIGILLLSLGVIHLINMYLFWKIRGAYSKPSGVPELQARLDRPLPPTPGQQMRGPIPPIVPG